MLLPNMVSEVNNKFGSILLYDGSTMLTGVVALAVVDKTVNLVMYQYIASAVVVVNADIVYDTKSVSLATFRALSAEKVDITEQLLDFCTQLYLTMEE